MVKKTEILKVLVGSHAHGLARPDSDHDYRGVYVVPTNEILSLGFNYKGSHWLEGETEDNTAYEMGHFLHLATKCNPTILEAFKAPVLDVGTKDNGEYVLYGKKSQTFWGQELVDLFPYIWNPKDAYNAFTGYGHNQRKKMLENHLDRWNKYATAYLRTLWNLIDLLGTGTFSLEVKEPTFKEYLINVRAGNITVGEVVNYAQSLEKAAAILLPGCKHEPDLVKVNGFLLKVRREFWE